LAGSYGSAAGISGRVRAHSKKCARAICWLERLGWVTKNLQPSAMPALPLRQRHGFSLLRGAAGGIQNLGNGHVRVQRRQAIFLRSVENHCPEIGEFTV